MARCALAVRCILDEHLRGQVMPEKDGRAVLPLAVQPGDEVLASKGGHPVWLNRRAGRGACQLVATAPPALQDGEFMFEHLNARRFLPLLPLMNFLRQLVKPMDWLSVSPRCCFVFDDPNLHRPSYGFLDYRLLAGHAVRTQLLCLDCDRPIGRLVGKQVGRGDIPVRQPATFPFGARQQSHLSRVVVPEKRGDAFGLGGPGPVPLWNVWSDPTALPFPGSWRRHMP